MSSETELRQALQDCLDALMVVWKRNLHVQPQIVYRAIKKAEKVLKKHQPHE